MTDLATVSGTVYHNTGAVSRKPWKDAQVQFVPLLLDETAALADSKRIVREMSDDNGHISVDLWPGAWRIILPDGEVIDGATHTGVVLVAGVVYTLLELRGFVPGPEQSVTVIEVPTGLAADVAQALGAADRAETAAGEAEQSASDAFGSAQDAALSAQAAQASETAAAESALSAAGSLDAVAASAAAAADSRDSAAGSATTATTQAGIATTQATNAAGSATSAATSASNAAATLANAVTLTGSQTITGAKTITAPACVAAVPDPVLGAEMAPALSTWTGAGGASWDGSQWTLPAGATISTTLTVVSATMYQVALTHPYIAQRPDAVQLGSVVRGTSEGSNRAVGIVASGSGSQTITIGGASWASTLSGVSVKPVTLQTAALSVGPATVRSSGSNVAVGYNAQQALTTGSSSVAVGYNAQQALTTGSSSVAVGYTAQYALTTGSSNVAVGHAAQYALTTGSSNVAVGHAAQQALTTGSSNVAVGYRAARTDGTTATVGTVNYTTCLGHQAQATVSNVAVIGSAITAERQTLCIGNYDALGSGVRGAIALSNAAITPTANPTGGGVLYADAGALKWRGPSGTITTIAPA